MHTLACVVSLGIALIRRFGQGRPAALALACALLLAGAAPAAQAGGFSVSPIRLELGGGARSGAVTVRNDDKAPLSFQVQGLSWRQDEGGQDVYEPAPELVFFPRMLTLEPGREAVIRVGTRQSLVPVEKAYRLFIEQLATPGGAAEAGQRVQFLVRFGAPIFVRPVQPSTRLALASFEASEGQARWAFVNEGNQHERFESLKLRGQDAAGQTLFERSIDERYLLAGRRRPGTLALPPEHCASLARLTLEARTEKSQLRREIPLGAPPCP